MLSHPPKLILAPMEGVTDWVMRDLLTSVGGIDQCVTEFLRVTDRLHPYSVFLKNCPELNAQQRPARVWRSAGRPFDDRRQRVSQP